MTYNLLADCYSWGIKKMEERYKMLFKETYYLGAGILCFQELEAISNAKLFYPLFKILGYDAKYKENPSGEGVAIYYDTKRFLTHRNAVFFLAHFRFFCARYEM